MKELNKQKILMRAIQQNDGLYYLFKDEFKKNVSFCSAVSLGVVDGKDVSFEMSTEDDLDDLSFDGDFYNLTMYHGDEIVAEIQLWDAGRLSFGVDDEDSIEVDVESELTRSYLKYIYSYLYNIYKDNS